MLDLFYLLKKRKKRRRRHSSYFIFNYIIATFLKRNICVKLFFYPGRTVPHRSGLFFKHLHEIFAWCVACCLDITNYILNCLGNIWVKIIPLTHSNVVFWCIWVLFLELHKIDIDGRRVLESFLFIRILLMFYSNMYVFVQ